MTRIILVLLWVLILAGASLGTDLYPCVDAVGTCSIKTIEQFSPQPTQASAPVQYQYGNAFDGLDEVNQHRARRGLHPYIRDEGLTQGAAAVCSYRASIGRTGHTRNDFSYLPAGVNANAAGCGWSSDFRDWLTCSTYENWRYAGAAWVQVGNGRFMHLFVSNNPSTVQQPMQTVQTTRIAESTRPVSTIQAAETPYDYSPFGGNCPNGRCGAPAQERAALFSRFRRN